MATGIFRMLGTKYWNEVVLPAYRKQHPIDAGKIEKALAGPPFPPNPHDAFALGIVEEIKERKQPIPSDPDPTPEPPISSSIFDTKYAFVRGPYSGHEKEKVNALVNTGYRTIALNVGDHSPGEWQNWRSLIGTRMRVVPWARCYLMADVLRLRSIAELWKSPGLIVNLEQNSGTPRWSTTGEEVASALKTYVGQIAVSTEPWLPENFNWLPLIQLGAVDLPQTSYLEFPFTPQVVVDRATNLFGFPMAIPSFSTYIVSGQRPTRQNYEWTKNFGIYTVDDVPYNQIAQWI